MDPRGPHQNAVSGNLTYRLITGRNAGPQNVDSLPHGLLHPVGPPGVGVILAGTSRISHIRVGAPRERGSLLFMAGP